MSNKYNARTTATLEPLESRVLLATTYYVSPAGNNNAAGTSPETAWKTLSKVSQRSFGPGDQILLQGGQSFSGNITLAADDNGTSGAPISLGSYGSGRATINSGNQQGVSIHNTDWIEVSDLVIVGSGRSTSNTDGLSAWNDMGNTQRLEHLRIDNVEVRSYGKNGIAVGGVLGSMGFKDVRITNSLIHDNGIDGLIVWGWSQYANEDIYIGDVRSMNNPGTPGVEWVSGSGILVEHSRNVLIERCIATNNGTLGNGGVGIWCHSSDSVTIQFNESYNNRTGGPHDGGGFAFDGGTTNSVMQYNYSHGNDGAGIGLYQFLGATAWSNNLVRYNISENDARRNSYGAIHVWNGSTEFPIANCNVYGNTIFLSPSGTYTPRVLKFVGINTNFKYRNNNFVTTGGAYFMIVNASHPGLAFQGNNWWSSGGTFNLTWQFTNHSSLSSWRNASGHERLNGAPVGFSVDPKLTSPGNGETIGNPDNLVNLTAYKLLASSPLINAGLNIAALFGSTPIRDFWGTTVPQGGNYDVGAHEVPGVPAAFQESNGRVDFQAEAFTGQAAGTGNAANHTWSQISDAAAGGGLALEATPNTGIATGDTTTGPRRDYSINFTNTGTYYVWVRSSGGTGNDDSLHVGLNGTLRSGGSLGLGTLGSWGWDNALGNGTRVTVNVPSPGTHTFNLWMREDGMKVDQFILTKDANFVPTGGGDETGGTVTIGPWTVHGNLPTPMMEGAVATINNMVYLWGGFNSGSTWLSQKHGWRYNTTTGVWTRMADLPAPITHGQMIVYGDRIYMFGGYANNGSFLGNTDAVYQYDPAANQFSLWNTIPYRISGHGAAMVGTRVHLLGGHLRDGQNQFVGNSVRHVSIDMANLAAGWRNEPDVPAGRDHVGSEYLDGGIYYFAGQINDDEYTGVRSEMWRYDVAAGTWSARASMPDGGRGHIDQASAIFSGRIITVAGNPNAPVLTNYSDEVFLYNPATNQWSTLGLIPDWRRGCQVSIIGDRLWVFGGGTSYPRDNLWSAKLTFTP